MFKQLRLNGKATLSAIILSVPLARQASVSSRRIFNNIKQVLVTKSIYFYSITDGSHAKTSLRVIMPSVLRSAAMFQSKNCNTRA